MNSERRDRIVTLICPTCGSDQFGHEGVEAPEQIVTCACCGLRMTRDDLIAANSENIDLHVKEMARQVAEDFRGELAKALRGSKFIRIE
jgi:uncharacterized Zn finger protein